MSIKLRTFSENSWIVSVDDGNLGLLSKTPCGYVLTVNNNKLKFSNKNEVITFFNEDIFTTNIPVGVVGTEEAIPLMPMLDGYPINSDKASQAFQRGINFPIFSIRKGSKVYYAAGHFCIKYSHSWTHAFCPKLSTLGTYEYIGPFTSLDVAKKELKLLKKNGQH